MRKFAIAFLRDASPSLHSHAFKFKGHPASVMFLNPLATGESRYEVADPEDEEVGASQHSALPDISMGALEPRGKTPIPKAHKAHCLFQDLRGTEGSFHAEISAVKAKKKAKASEKGREKPKASAELAGGKASELPDVKVANTERRSTDFGALKTESEAVYECENAVQAKKKAKASEKGRKKAIENAELAGEEATELTDIRVASAERCSIENGVLILESEAVYECEDAEQNAATGKSENVALHAKANANTHHVQEDISKYAAELEVNTFKCGRQWEEAARKLVDYGIPYVHVVKMLQKCKNLSCTQNCADSTLQNFSTLGMSNKEIGCAISRWPTILNITNTMFQSKVEFFESVGIGRRTLCKMICVAPMVITYSLTALREYWGFWNKYMQDVQLNAMCVMLAKDPKLLTYSLQNTVMPKIAYFEEQGYDKKILLKYSSILGMSLASFASKNKLLEQFGMLNGRKRSWAIAMLRGISYSGLHARFHNLLAAGLSLHQIQDVISKSPQVLCLSEDHINVKLSYAVNVMNISLDALLAYPTYWTHSFEKRIKYRYEVIQELRTLGGLKKELSPGYMVCMTDADFCERFVEKLKDCAKHPDAPSV